MYSFNLTDSVFLRADCFVINFSFKLGNSSSLSSHIYETCCKFSSLLWNWQNNCPQNNSGELLYCTLVIPVLYGMACEFASTNYKWFYSARLGQRKFLRHASFILGFQCPPSDYTWVVKHLNLVFYQPIVDGRQARNGLSGNVIKSHTVLSFIWFKIAKYFARAPMYFQKLTTQKTNQFSNLNVHYRKSGWKSSLNYFVVLFWIIFISAHYFHGKSPVFNLPLGSKSHGPLIIQWMNRT